MLILVCNVGSTSIKCKIFDMPKENLLAEAKIDRIGNEKSSFIYKNYRNYKNITTKNICVSTHTEGIDLFLKYIVDKENGMLSSINELDVVGFKTVHAKDCTGVQVLTEDIIRRMKEYINVAPLHNIFYMKAIERFKEVLPNKLMVGVFETAFHRTIPEEARIYGVPYNWYEKYGIQKYGFHGASHQYIAQRVRNIINCEGNELKIISCHLGGSSSLCAIRNGESIDNSFGFSTQSGIIHANRVGDLDPFVIIYLMKEEGFSLDQIIEALVYKGGLYGISGVSSDLRDIEKYAAKGNPRAILAIKTFTYNVKKYTGSYFAILGGLDFLIFTGGIGENSPLVRSKICSDLKHMGIFLDKEKNLTGNHERIISPEGAPVKVMIIPTNEELCVVKNVYSFLNKSKI